MKKFWKDFGAFIAKGNALDLAVGVVIGTAFNAIVNSLVKDIIMPFVSLLVGKDITNWFWVMRGTAVYDTTTGAYVFSSDAVVMYYGNFLQTIVNFFLIGLSVFVALRAIALIRRELDDAKTAIFKNEEEPQAEPQK